MGHNLSRCLPAGKVALDLGVQVLLYFDKNPARGCYNPATKQIYIYGRRNRQTMCVWFHELAHAVDDYLHIITHSGISTAEGVAYRTALKCCRYFGYSRCFVPYTFCSIKYYNISLFNECVRVRANAVWQILKPHLDTCTYCATRKRDW